MSLYAPEKFDHICEAGGNPNLSASSANDTIANPHHGMYEAIVASNGLGSQNLAFLVQWESQVVECCGEEMELAPANCPPVWDCVPHGLRGAPTQCSRCGRHRVPEVQIRRIHLEDRA
jgi:hypothetical protein